MATRTRPIRKADHGHSMVTINEEFRNGFLRNVRVTCQCGHKVGSTRGDRDGVIRRFTAHQNEA